MLPYFRKTDRDLAFYEEYINPRLPARLFDMHLHVTRPSDTVNVKQEQIDKDWAMQCGFRMDEQDLAAYMQTLWGDREVSVNAFPMPIRGVDLASANLHLEHLLSDGKVGAHLTFRTAEMAISPDMDPAACEEMLLRGGFIGYKPYPDLVSGEKGAEIRIPDFLPDAFMQSLDRHGRAVTIHLPRAGRIASPDNIREMLELRKKFPKPTPPEPTEPEPADFTAEGFESAPAPELPEAPAADQPSGANFDPMTGEPINKDPQPPVNPEA